MIDVVIETNSSIEPEYTIQFNGQLIRTSLNGRQTEPMW